MKKNRPVVAHPFNGLTPIGKVTLFAIFKHLKDAPMGKPDISALSNRYGITKSKTEKLLNFGIDLGFIEIEMDNREYPKLYGAKEYRRFSLTAQGKNYLDRNPS